MQKSKFWIRAGIGDNFWRREPILEQGVQKSKFWIRTGTWDSFWNRERIFELGEKFRAANYTSRLWLEQGVTYRPFL